MPARTSLSGVARYVRRLRLHARSPVALLLEAQRKRADNTFGKLKTERDAARRLVDAHREKIDALETAMQKQKEDEEIASAAIVSMTMQQEEAGRRLLARDAEHQRLLQKLATKDKQHRMEVEALGREVARLVQERDAACYMAETETLEADLSTLQEEWMAQEMQSDINQAGTSGTGCF